MKPVMSFVDIEDSWEGEYLGNSLRETGSVKTFDETADVVLDKIKDASILSPFIHSMVNKEMIDAMPNLKFITTRSTGFDHVDTAYAKSKGIVVSNVPTYGENTVAEHTFALILSVARNLKKSQFKISEGDFSIKELMGFDLKGKTIGVVGTGHIGLRVIKMAVGFSMKVLAFDPTENQFLSEILGFRYVDFETLLRESDIITLHAPYGKKTHHMINEGNMGLIKKGAVLINTARGGLVDTIALTKALDEGILSGAGLDVLEGEDLILEEKQLLRKKKELYNPEKLQLTLRNAFILQRENVVFTPHIAFYSKEALKRILDTTVENIKSFLKGSPINVVNPAN
ncbi:MAG: hydroxyacid dehydrogenase [Candidatus Omnitrophica bacterium]|nr:hydroxyacid dehydrogenase [Candidatus Omnitrophota bacterium]MBU4487819.1 hydroxyacid dehydrogenase [Candidatus Omnitrophota bacterium]MCG2705541.1 hydroxyacid dehydrogenase [Candidatus Omnitrophota bacterium]